MLRLTPKMANSSQSIPTSCKMWFPFDDGSGNTITDSVGGLVITDDATAEHTTANAIQFKASGAVTSGTLPVIATGKSIIMIYAGIVGAGGGGLSSMAFSNTGAEAEVGFGGAGGFTINSIGPSPVTTAYQTLSATAVRIGTFNNADGVISAYSSIDGAALALDNTADGSNHINGDFSYVTQSATIGGAIQDDKWYGCAVYAVDTLPSASTIITAGAEIYDNWVINGIKILPLSFADLK